MVGYGKNGALTLLDAQLYQESNQDRVVPTRDVNTQTTVFPFSPGQPNPNIELTFDRLLGARSSQEALDALNDGSGKCRVCKK